MAPPEERDSAKQRCLALESYFVNSCTDLAVTRSVQADTGNSYTKGNLLHQTKFELLRLWIPSKF